MVTLTDDELNDLRLEKGEAAVRAHYEAEMRNVFGHDVKFDKDGKPIERGVGSASQPSANSVSAYERFCRNQPDFAATLAKMKADLAAYEARRRGG